MGLRPEDNLACRYAGHVRAAGGGTRLLVVDSRKNAVAGLVVGNVDVRSVVAKASAGAAGIQNLTIDEEVLTCFLLIVALGAVGDDRPVLRRVGAVAGGFDVLGCVEAEAVNTAVDARLEQIESSLLHSRVARVEVRTIGNVALNRLLDRIVIRIQVVAAEVGGTVVVEIRLIGLDLLAERVGRHLGLISEVVGYDIADNLDTVLVSLGAKGGQLRLGTEP